jgi:methionyl-tRNA formyltransferase
VSLRGRFSEYFSASDIALITGHKLDFILRFAFGIVRGAILRAPRYGVWSFHHDDEVRYRRGPPAFWEIHRGEGVTLRRLPADVRTRAAA